MIVVEKPIVNFENFSPEKRKDGLSGFMRLRNEGEFISQTIESWLPLLDELIIVFNNCQDDTEEIVKVWEEKYPEKIKVYHYVPIVYPQGSEKYKSLESDNVHSLVHYYNFALSKTTKRWAVKLDGDLILAKGKAEVIRKQYNYIKENDTNAILPLSGINIIEQKGKIYVPSNSKYCGAGIHPDRIVFRVDKDTVFKKNSNCEYLDCRERKVLKNIFCSYHLKFVKSDFGIGNYNFSDNSNSTYYPKQLLILFTLKLIPLQKLLEETQMPNLSAEEYKQWSGKTFSNYKKEAFEYYKSLSIPFKIVPFLKECAILLILSNKFLLKTVKFMKNGEGGRVYVPYFIRFFKKREREIVYFPRLGYASYGVCYQ